MRFTSFTAAAMAGMLILAGCSTSYTDAKTDEIVVTGTRSSGAVSEKSSEGRLRGDAGEAEKPMAPPPPPPPPPPSVMAEPSPGALAELADAAPAAGLTTPPDSRVEKQLPQSGTLTAGDYDDVLNPDLYRIYLKKMLRGALAQKELPYVDAADRIEVRLTDRLGKPVPFADIDILDADGQKMFPLRTGAKGQVFLYPKFDALGDKITIRARAPGSTEINHVIELGSGKVPEVVTMSFKSDAPKVEMLDLLLTVDATGSMADEMRYLQSELLAILGRVRESQGELDIHAGLIVYRDKGDAYIVRDFDFTGDLDAFAANLKAQSADGGGDFPEAMQDAMAKGLEFSWRADAVKVNMLVADAPPHDGDIDATWTSGLISRTKGIHIVPLAASGVDDTAEFLMRAMSQITGGRYLFLTDDSGVGNAHAEPDGDEVIRVVGDYKAGICKVEDAES